MITVIILLILAGVSIKSLIGENGLIKHAQLASKKFSDSTEEEYIKMEMNLYNMPDKEQNKNILYLQSEELINKNIENSFNWKIIVLNDENKTTYGNGWRILKKGTQITEFGEIKSNWLLNFGENKCIKIDDTNSFTELNANDSLAITDSLVFGIDSSIIEKEKTDKIDNLASKLGNNVELVGFNEDDNKEESGLTNNSFNLDGIDDYIKVKFDDEKAKEKLAKNGFTFEIYGRMQLGTSYQADGTEWNYGFKGLFCYWNGIESKQASLRFGIYDKEYFGWNAGLGKYFSDFSYISKSPQNQKFSGHKIDFSKENYYTITLDCSNYYEKDNEKYYKQSLYLNGVKILEGGYNAKSWEEFINNDENMPSLTTFCIGRSSHGADGCWHYTKLNTNALRLYSRALTEDEVKENYNKSKNYHELLME